LACSQRSLPGAQWPAHGVAHAGHVSAAARAYGPRLFSVGGWPWSILPSSLYRLASAASSTLERSASFSQFDTRRNLSYTSLTVTVPLLFTGTSPGFGVIVLAPRPTPTVRGITCWATKPKWAEGLVTSPCTVPLMTIAPI